VHVLHGDVVLAVLDAHVVDVRDVRMIERRGDTRFAEKHRDEVLVLG
jgi:hypothetical protein